MSEQGDDQWKTNLFGCICAVSICSEYASGAERDPSTTDGTGAHLTHRWCQTCTRKTDPLPTRCKYALN